MGFLTDKEVNRGRQPEIDCLKAFCIVPMILLHVFEECAEELGLAYDMLHVLEVLTGAAAFMIHFTIAELTPPKRTIVFAAIWIAVILVVVYAYPRVTELATISNDFLMS